MEDNVIDTLRIEVTSDSSKAVSGIDKLISTLERIKSVTGGSNKGLSSIKRNLESISKAADKINSDSISKIDKLAESMKSLSTVSKIKISSKIADRILDIGAAIDCLKDVDFSKFTEMTNGLQALGEVGNVRIPNISNTQGASSSNSSEPTSTPLEMNVNPVLNSFEKIQESAIETADKIGKVTEAASTPINVDEFIQGKSELDILQMKLEATKNKLGDLLKNGEKSDISGIANLLSAIKQLEEKIKKADKSIHSFKEGLKKLGDIGKAKFKSIGDSISNSLTMITKRAAYRAINAAISAVTGAFKDGVNAAYQYSKTMDGQLAKSLDSIATSMNYLKNSLGAMVAPLINMVAPAIEVLVDKFVGLLNIMNQVFARLSGASTWTKATKVATEYAEAADSATAANKKLKKSLLGIDEINALQDNSSSGSGSSGSGANSAIAFQEVPLDISYVDGVIDKLKDILWYAGAIGLAIKAWNFGEALGNILKNIPALKDMKIPYFAAGLTVTVASLTIMVKGAIDIISNGIDWQNFTEMLLSGGGLVAGGALIGKAFGNSVLGAAIGAIVGGVGMYITGIWDAIKEGLNWLNSALIGAGATLAGAGIGAIIGMCGGPIGAGIGALIGLAVGALTDLVILIVQNWDAVCAWCSEALSNIGQFFVDLWQGVVDVWNVCAEWFNTNVIQPVADFFVGLWNGISEAASTCWNAIVEFFSPAIEWFSELFGSIWQTISDIFYDIGVIASGCWEIIKAIWGIVSDWFNEHIITPVANFFSTMWNNIKGWAISAWNGIKSVFSTIGNWIYEKVISPVANFFSGLWNGFVEKAKTAWNGVKQVFSKVASFFKDTFEKAWKGIVKVFSIAGEIFVDIKDGIVEAFKFVVNGIIKGLNKVISVPFEGINWALNKIKNIEIVGIKPFDSLKTINIPQIPLLAGGGIPATGQMFIAREAGAELVGNVGRKTGVMNNDQIVESVSQGVADANAEQNALLREEISILRKILEKDSSTTAYVGTGSLISGLERKNRRDGRTIVPIGV